MRCSAIWFVDLSLDTRYDNSVTNNYDVHFIRTKLRPETVICQS